jgi:SAM-dependent methyltransferase
MAEERKTVEPPTGERGNDPGSAFPRDYSGPAKTDKERIAMLEAKTAFLLDEVSELRRLLRRSLEESRPYQDEVERSRRSFDFQWQHLPEGKAMLSNEEWKAGVTATMARFTGLPPAWFAGRAVLDAGCGLGRWTYGFGRLGVASCHSFDISAAACAKTAEVAAAFGPGFTVATRDLTRPLEVAEAYDLVWCFGAIHHTGAPYAAFANLAPLVKPGGYLFVMLYGEPRPAEMGDYGYYHTIFETRCRVRHLRLPDKVNALEKKFGPEHLHGYFDAVSPEVNDRFRWDEVVHLFQTHGFSQVTRTLPDHPNHHVIGRKD